MACDSTHTFKTINYILLQNTPHIEYIAILFNANNFVTLSCFDKAALITKKSPAVCRAFLMQLRHLLLALPLNGVCPRGYHTR